MKIPTMKKWVLSLAIASVASTGYAANNMSSSNSNIDSSAGSAATQGSSSSVNRSESVSRSESINRTDLDQSGSRTTNRSAASSNRGGVDPASQPATESTDTYRRDTYTSTEIQSSDRAKGKQVHQQPGVDREETLQFENNSLALTDESENKLETLVESLDKSKPVAVTVEVQDSLAASSSTYREPAVSTPSDPAANNPVVSSSEPGMKDSSTGYPTDNQSVTDSTVTPANPSSAMDPAADPQREARERNTQALSQYRAESVRQFLEEKGVDVVEWNVEGLGKEQSIQVTEENGQPVQNVQQIRIVIDGEADRKGLSAL